MSDDKSKTGKPDDSRVAGGQPYEVRYVMEQHGITQSQAEEAIRKAGPMREDVNAYIKKHY